MERVWPSTYDASLVMKDAGLVAASAAATVSAAAQILNVGPGVVKGVLHIHVTAVEIADDDERFEVTIQGSNSATFASGNYDLGIMAFGAKEVLAGDTDSVAGDFYLPFSNVYEATGSILQYLRVYTLVSGTVGTGINYTARFSWM